MPSRVQPEWWIEERPAEWDAADTKRRSYTGCRRSGGDVGIIGLIDNGCNSSLVNQCALNTYWLPEGWGKAPDIGSGGSGSVQITGQVGAPKYGHNLPASGAAAVSLTGQVGAVQLGVSAVGGSASVQAAGQVGTVTV